MSSTSSTTPTPDGLVAQSEALAAGDLTASALVDATLEASFEKYFHMGSLMGSYEKCLDTVSEMERIGVDELACLVDFGLDPGIVSAGLENLNVLRKLANPAPLARAERVAQAAE